MSRVPVFTAEAALAAARTRVPAWPKANALAMYSSALGGIVTDPAVFAVPLDDHIVTRGHGVFDTCNIHNGKAYGLEFHLDRLFKSAAQARIERLPSRDVIKEAILATLATAGERDGVFARFWLSAGRGDFAISSRGLAKNGAVGGEEGAASFYAVVHRNAGAKGLEGEGLHEATVGVPLKNQLLATLKSTNYLINALTAMEAEDKGGTLGVQLDEGGFIVESSIASVAIVTPAGVLKSPSFDYALASTTVVRAFALAQSRLDADGPRLGLTKVVQEPVSLDEAYAASEMFLLGGGGVVPVISLDGRRIGAGRPGPTFRWLWKLLDDDLRNEEHTDPIPYELYAAHVQRRPRLAYRMSAGI
ncbi:aminotransferase [Pavlovales sp. CCMP2436]|nr:aminotransferase [Pavlovales sp. CCMP2436]